MHMSVYNAKGCAYRDLLLLRPVRLPLILFLQGTGAVPRVHLHQGRVVVHRLPGTV